MNFLKSKRKVSLVLGSGGARGLVQIGVIRSLEEKGYEIDEVVGCSIGSLIGAAYVEGKMGKLEDWMRSITRRQVFKLMDFTNPKFGLLKGERVFESLKEIFPDKNIEDMDIPFRAIATDMVSEKEVVFDKGSVYKAIRASIAIPAVFTSIESEDWNLVDGGVINPLPINYVRRKRRNIIIAVNLDGKPDAEYGPYNGAKGLNALSMLQESYFMMRRRLSQLSVELYKPDYVINIPHNIAGIWDYDKASFMIEKGKELTDKVVPDVPIKKKEAKKKNKSPKEKEKEKEVV
ncbi:phospholipase [Sphingobacterium mizutaii NBRC 14946 = DSM 11724]|uniref:NTE family protein rssA n=2 Tax=Sphingobacterium mizutaii TaxID=1010 RepID=A0AAJ5BZM0_9SPHI|nr:patatin-like phospholipase family protein [Sphingobacterium mizutaii]GEM68880.1 phospholipase [Sphingobacterium mizutaii NBRC 14946 = DSM 11724]SDK89447.1 NTE family protein [Sphingobacterium mizutaii]SNV46922.1 NTE family protein rssA [Sphingobacterium mizutaii]